MTGDICEKTDKEALREFRRLRNFYRNNYKQGHNDDAFLLWIEEMCDFEFLTTNDREVNVK